MKNLILAVLFLAFCSTSMAANHVGVIVKKQGTAELLVSPSSKVVGKGPHVLFEGKYYTLKKVRLGLKVDNGSVVRTGKDAKLKIVYKNGDQFNIGEATAYRVSWKSDKKVKDDPSTVDLMYGSIRGIVNKKGPRSGMKVKTKHAVMGIRGTDFHIGQRGTSGKSSVSVLRGKVAVADAELPSKKVEVAQGFSAELKTEVKNTKPNTKEKKVKAASTLAVVKTTKNDLVAIQKDSNIKENKEDKVTEKVKKELASLEKKAVENTLSDIKDYDPELYNAIKDKKIDDIDNINKVVVGKVFEKAPEKKVKVGIEDLNLEENAYDKYFKID